MMLTIGIIGLIGLVVSSIGLVKVNTETRKISIGLLACGYAGSIMMLLIASVNFAFNCFYGYK